MTELKIADIEKIRKYLSDLGVDPAETHTTHHNVEVVNIGEKITLPVTMSLDDAIKTLMARKKAMEEPIEFSEDFDVFPWDGAFALSESLKQRFGWTEARGVISKSLFGEKEEKPMFLNIEIGPGETGTIMWGGFSIPGSSIVMRCDFTKKAGRFIFQAKCNLRRADENLCKSILADLRVYLKEHSIYRGKAVRLRFLSDDGDTLKIPEISFIDTSRIDPSQLIFSKEVEAQVNAYLFTPIEKVEELGRNGIKVKRAVILGGIYGTGKTMAAMVASKKAVDHDITFLYIARADELALALAFAKQYMNPAAIVFCEDVDRVASGERTKSMDDLLNMVDGLDTKKDQIIAILTTNKLEQIHPAMIRRATIIEVTPPDGEAVERLLRKYAEDTIDADTDLSEVGEVLAGNTPSVIADTLEKAKLSQLMLNPKGRLVEKLSSEALLVAARYMQRQIALSRDPATKAEPTIDTLMAKAFNHMVNNDGDAENYKVVKSGNGDARAD